jgi:hypothetical protein
MFDGLPNKEIPNEIPLFASMPELGPKLKCSVQELALAIA